LEILREIGGLCRNPQAAELVPSASYCAQANIDFCIAHPYLVCLFVSSDSAAAYAAIDPIANAQRSQSVSAEGPFALRFIQRSTQAIDVESDRPNAFSPREKDPGKDSVTHRDTRSATS
jgi:hypothetical protein